MRRWSELARMIRFRTLLIHDLKLTDVAQRPSHSAALSRLHFAHAPRLRKIGLLDVRKLGKGFLQVRIPLGLDPPLLGFFAIASIDALLQLV